MSPVSHLSLYWRLSNKITSDSTTHKVMSHYIKQETKLDTFKKYATFIHSLFMFFFSFLFLCLAGSFYKMTFV